jgi:hypothetical protein
MCLLPIIAILAGGGSVAAEDGSYLLLAPGASVEARFHGVCKRLTNVSLETQVYVPIADPRAWEGFDSRNHDDGPMVRVSACHEKARSADEGDEG